MAVEFLIGPAGSGKTHACLTQVRKALAAPEGPPLLWIAPKQFTFQLEHEVLRRGVRGFTRLEILPFDRVARRVLGELGVPIRDVLPEEGRMMVLDAILAQEASKLTVFSRSAGAPGFASQLSQVLRELQHGGIGTERLRSLRLAGDSMRSLSGKLQDLALLLETYRQWLKPHQLRDPDELLPLAAEALATARAQGKPVPSFAGLWLDGFAEMTVPELDLLVELLPGCDQATLAFCLDPTPDPSQPAASSPPASIWSVTAATYLRCQERIRNLGLTARVRHLPENGGGPPRFWDSGALARLASAWTGTAMDEGRGHGGLMGSDGINLVECVDPEAEALLAVRLINRHVRQDGGRYRDISVIVRRMEGYGDVVQRAFRRHGIPYFADHREPMGHHPVAELTRSALSMAAGGWAHEDWMGALKSGLVVEDPGFVDELENAGLASGLRGDEWMRLDGYRVKAGLTLDAARELENPIAAFVKLRSAVGSPVSGVGLADALRTLWRDLGVAERLEAWQASAGDLPPVYRAIHHTAWEQILAWCDALALAFGDTELPVHGWRAIAEAGLSRLTLGIIPPALDQVLLGAIDRMRQPEVKLTMVLGLNEGVFPAAPAPPALLNHTERQVLAEGGLNLGWSRIELAAREHYYAYIACTRPGRRLCLSWSRRGFDGKVQVRSSVAERVLAMVGLKADHAADVGDVTVFDGRLKAFDGEPRPEEAVSLSELLECPGWDRSLPADGKSALRTVNPVQAHLGNGLRARMTPASFVEAAATAARVRAALQPAGGESARRLAPEAVASLHPHGVLVSSVSALEDFAQCPFRHFAGKELRLEERDEFTADAAGAGTLLHAILKEFHERSIAERGGWRQWSPREASQFVGVLGEAQLKEPKFAPLIQDDLRAWETRRKIRGLAAMLEQAVTWMATCAFDPVGAELRFGDDPGCALPAWTLPLEAGRSLTLRGSIDRVDVCRVPEGPVLVAVFDYKSTARAPSAAELEHGFELQLLAYLALAAGSDELRKLISPGAAEAPAPQPAGAFYVPLAPKVGSADWDATEEELQRNYLESLTHQGRGDKQWLGQFDSVAGAANRRGDSSRQFRRSHLLDGKEFLGQMANTVGFLERHAVAILEGKVSVEPIRYGVQDTACDHCSFGALCRFEPLLGGFRTLLPATPSSKPVTAARTPSLAAGQPSTSTTKSGDEPNAV